MEHLMKRRSDLILAAQAIVDGAKAAARDLTGDENTALEAKLTEVKSVDAQIADARKSADLVAQLSGFGQAKAPEQTPADEAIELGGLSIGEKFAKSPGYRAFMKAHPAGVGSGTPIHVEAKGIGGLADLGIGVKAPGATITTASGQAVPAQLYPGYRSTLIDQRITFLDLITTGTTTSSWIEYAQIVSENDNAAIVDEGALKPLSDLATDKADAKAFTYADGFDITNQTLADEGALAAYMQTRLTWHLRNKLEDVLLNGNGIADPKGILNTTGTDATPFRTDVITTLGDALAYLEGIQVEPQAIVMNPADLWSLRLLRENGATGAYLNGNPFQQSGNLTPFGVPLVPSSRVAAGTAVVGNFSGVQLLMREGLSITAFNQHKDYAQRNMTYVRAELRALQFIYAPREITIADLTA